MDEFIDGPFQFDLVCPECELVNVVVTSADTPVVDWICGRCETQPITSLPTTDDGVLIAAVPE